METHDLFDGIRQRCGDVNAISPEAEVHLKRIISIMANDQIQLFLAAQSARTARFAYEATGSTEALAMAQACEEQLDARIEEMNRHIHYGMPPEEASDVTTSA